MEGRALLVVLTAGTRVHAPAQAVPSLICLGFGPQEGKIHLSRSAGQCLRVHRPRLCLVVRRERAGRNFHICAFSCLCSPELPGQCLPGVPAPREPCPVPFYIPNDFLHCEISGLSIYSSQFLHREVFLTLYFIQALLDSFR